LISVFKGPNYTGENTIEISCHGSPYIQQQIIQLLLRKGCRMADAGEFTLRAFWKLDLSQAEAVADLISSDKASHQIAMQQMRGGFSNEIAKLREELQILLRHRIRIRLPKKTNLQIEHNFTNS
jgi:tRNA modification GTPase